MERIIQTDANHAAELAPGTERYEDLPKEELADEIEMISPEGRPADPEFGPKRMGLFLSLLVGVILLIGVVTAVFGSVIMGFAFVVLGLAWLFVNPAVWASVARARERNEAKQHIDQAHVVHNAMGVHPGK